jgi:peroxiredoxin
MLFKTDQSKSMKNKLIILLGLVVLSCSVQRGLAADATTELEDLVAKVKTDLAAGKNTESGLAGDLKQFDLLLAEHKGEQTDAVARILFMKAMLYEEVLHDPAKADELKAQLKTEFKDTAFVTRLEKQEAAEAAAKEIQAALVVGNQFPDFNEKDLAGKPLSVANYKGKVLMIDFWATWCGPCVGELPHVIATYQKHHAQGFEIIGVSLDQDQTKLTDFIKAKGMTWQQFFDGQGWGNKLAVKYGVRAIPATFLIDGEGRIIGKDLRGEALEAAVANALANK